MKILQRLILIFSIVLIMLLLVRGMPGNGLAQATAQKGPGQVFESSIAAGRYALVLAVAEDHSLNLSQAEANFAAPDVSRLNNGRFVSIWPPGSALILLPFYLLGRMVNLGQLAVNFGVLAFCLANCYLLYLLVKRFGLKGYMAILPGILYLFASNAFAYSITIAQHQFTVFLMLAMMNLAIGKPNLAKHLVMWLVYGFSIVVDLPNAALLLPIALYVLVKHMIPSDWKDRVLQVRINYWLILITIVAVIPVGLMLKYNQLTTNNYLGFGQGYTRYALGKDVADDTKEVKTSAKKIQGLALPFDVTKMPFGLNTLIFTYERGIIFFSPILALGVLGILPLYRKYRNETQMIVGIIAIDFLLYSMFADVSGGWSFGPRYLIPSFAVLSVLVVYALQTYIKKFWFILLFTAITVFSIAVNAVGAVSTVLIPPVSEASGLGLDPTINLSIKQIQTNVLGSYAYNIFFKGSINGVQFYLLIAICAALVFLWVLFNAVYEQQHAN